MPVKCQLCLRTSVKDVSGLYIGGVTSFCDLILDSFMTVGNDPFYGRLFDAVLGAIPDFHIMIQTAAWKQEVDPNPDTTLGTYNPAKTRLSFYIDVNLSSIVLQANLQEIIRHEMIHALLHAKSKKYGKDFLQNNTIFGKEKFKQYFAAFSDGMNRMYETKKLLLTYREDPNDLTEEETYKIKSLIALLAQEAREDGTPIWSMIIAAEREKDFFVRKSGRIIAFKESSDGVVVEHKVGFVEENKVANRDPQFFIALKDVPLSYLAGLLMQEAILSNKEYLKKLQSGDAEELFAYPFGKGPLVLVKEFYRPLYDELVMIVAEVGQSASSKLLVRQWENVIHFHPAYVIRVDDLYNTFDKKFVTATNANFYIETSGQILDTKDYRKYFLVESVLQKIIKAGFVVDKDKVKSQIFLGRVMYRQGNKIEAYDVYHQAAKNALKHMLPIPMEDVDNYREVHDLAQTQGKQKSGDANMIGQLKTLADMQAQYQKRRAEL